MTHTSFYDIAQWVLLVISLAGEYLIIKKNVVGFYIWLGVCVGWMIIDFIAGLYGQSASWILYIGVCIYGILEWNKENKIYGRRIQV